MCDVFKKFIDVCLSYYNLDPCHYFSSPGLSWDAMLKMTGIQLEKINNFDVHLFLEKGMRDGISYISKRYSKMDSDKAIMYWDANNLYGWAMIQDLPYCDFKFLSQKEINEFNLNISESGSMGYILDVDILSSYCKGIADQYCIKVGGVKKLIPNLCDKVKYVVHYKNLEYYLSLGMKLIKIHRILSFKQSNWLKSYVDFNTEKRKQSSCDFKNFFKLMINYVYGKSMENIRKRINVKLINDQKTCLNCVNKPNFISQKIFDKNFVAVHCVKTVLTLTKPIYVGFCILELSKLLMYQFHYDYVLKTFNAKLLFTDTDSLVYEIRNDNIYDQCYKDKHLFDFSGYSKDSIYYDSLNKKVLGKMKDELNGVNIFEFVGLKSKMYSLIENNDKEVNKAKGVKKKLRHQEYLSVLFGKKVVRHKMKRIQSNLQRIGTYDINKISLSCFDDKRHVFDCGINTLAYFHKDIDYRKN